MKFQSTFNQLVLFRKDIEEQSREHPSFKVFHKQKIKDFFDRNRLKLDQIDKSIQRLIKKYVQHDEAGKSMMQPDENNVQKFVFNDDASKTAFGEEYNLLMSTNIEVDW